MNSANLCVLQWNSHSILNKLHWFKNPTFTKPQVLVFQESFLKPGLSFNLPNKIIYRKDRKNLRGGGLIIAIDSKISSREFEFNNLISSDVEILAVKIFIKNICITIVNIYSPRGKFCNTWLDGLANQLTPPFLILGDFNIQHLALGSSSSSPDGEKLSTG